MRGTWQTTDDSGKGWVLLLGAAAVVALASGAAAAISEVTVILLAAAGGVVVLLLALGGWWLLRMHRRGDFAPVVRWQPQALPAPEPRRSVPVQAPPQITNNFYGYSAAEVARAVAEQHAINEGK